MTGHIRDRTRMMKNEVNAQMEQNLEKLKLVQTTVKEGRDEINDLQSACQAQLEMNTLKSSILDVCKNCEDKLRKLENKAITSIPSMSTLNFNPGEKEMEKIQKMIGIIQGVDKDKVTAVKYADGIELIKEITLSKNGILCMDCNPAKQILVMCFYEQMLSVLDEDGTVIRQIQIHGLPSTISPMNQSNLLLAIPGENVISKISLQSKSKPYPIPFVYTEDLKPYGLAVQTSPTVEILVGLVDKYDFSPTSYSMRLLRCYSSESKPIKDVQYDDKGRQLFTIPRKIAINPKNQDVAVINLVSENRGEIEVIDSCGFLKAKLTKIPALISIISYSIHPTDIQFNALGNLVFIDQNWKSIMTLDDGYSKVLKSYKVGNIGPSSLCCPPTVSHIWVGRMDGKINLYKYMKQDDDVGSTKSSE